MLKPKRLKIILLMYTHKSKKKNQYFYSAMMH